VTIGKVWKFVDVQTLSPKDEMLHLERLGNFRKIRNSIVCPLQMFGNLWMFSDCLDWEGLEKLEKHFRSS